MLLARTAKKDHTDDGELEDDLRNDSLAIAVAVDTSLPVKEFVSALDIVRDDHRRLK